MLQYISMKQDRPETRLAKIPVPGALLRLVQRVPNAELYIVGGCVRDALLGRKPSDVDFLIRKISYDRIARSLKRFGKAELVGKQFGVVKFTPRGSRETYDIALPRLEHSLHYTGGYHDFVVHPSSRLPIEADLGRRDFTINAMAWEVRTKRFIDPYGGLNDLASRTIRTVGSPALRFREDYSRMLRALRIAIQLDFIIEPATWRTLRAMVGHLNESIVPRETIASEFMKMFSQNPLETVDLCDLSGILRTLMPEAEKMKECLQQPEHHREGSVWNHARLCIEAFSSPVFQRVLPDHQPDPELLFAAWLHDVGKPFTCRMERRAGHDVVTYHNHEVAGADIAAGMAERLRLSSVDGSIQPERIQWLIKNHLLILNADSLRPNTVEKYFCNPHRSGEKLLALMLADTLASLPLHGEPRLDGIRLLKAKIALVRRRGYTRSQPIKLLTGSEIMRALHLTAGPKVGALLDDLRTAQLEGRVRTKQQAKRYLARLISKPKQTAE
jgi:tRNA nucleotidyltransferase/poly(A) polymerase